VEIAAALIVAAAGAAVLADRLAVWHRRRQIVRPRPSVLVVTRDDVTFSGTLWSRSAGIVELRGAELVHPDGATDTLTGSVILDVSAVAWIQAAPSLED
jgi:hypothetical protein